MRVTRTGNSARVVVEVELDVDLQDWAATYGCATPEAALADVEDHLPATIAHQLLINPSRARSYRDAYTVGPDDTGVTLTGDLADVARDFQI